MGKLKRNEPEEEGLGVRRGTRGIGGEDGLQREKERETKEKKDKETVMSPR